MPERKTFLFLPSFLYHITVESALIPAGYAPGFIGCKKTTPHPIECCCPCYEKMTPRGWERLQLVWFSDSCDWLMMKAVREGEEFFLFFFFGCMYLVWIFFCHQHKRRTKRLSAFGFSINNYPFARNVVFVRARAWMSVQGERNFNPILQMHLVSRVHVCFLPCPSSSREGSLQIIMFPNLLMMS